MVAEVETGSSPLIEIRWRRLFAKKRTIVCYLGAIFVVFVMLYIVLGAMFGWWFPGDPIGDNTSRPAAFGVALDFPTQTPTPSVTPTPTQTPKPKAPAAAVDELVFGDGGPVACITSPESSACVNQQGPHAIQVEIRARLKDGNTKNPKTGLYPDKTEYEDETVQDRRTLSDVTLACWSHFTDDIIPSSGWTVVSTAKHGWNDAADLRIEIFIAPAVGQTVQTATPLEQLKSVCQPP